jgi:fatty acid-binding protein DegV
MYRVTRQYVEDRLTGRTDIDTSRIFVTHTRCPEELVNAVVARVRELVPDAGEILETTAGSTVTVHCGPNTLGVLFIRKP